MHDTLLEELTSSLYFRYSFSIAMIKDISTAMTEYATAAVIDSIIQAELHSGLDGPYLGQLAAQLVKKYPTLKESEVIAIKDALNEYAVSAVLDTEVQKELFSEKEVRRKACINCECSHN